MILATTCSTPPAWNGELYITKYRIVYLVVAAMGHMIMLLMSVSDTVVANCTNDALYRATQQTNAYGCFAAVSSNSLHAPLILNSWSVMCLVGSSAAIRLDT